MTTQRQAKKKEQQNNMLLTAQQFAKDSKNFFDKCVKPTKAGK